MTHTCQKVVLADWVGPGLVLGWGPGLVLGWSKPGPEYGIWLGTIVIRF